MDPIYIPQYDGYIVDNPNIDFVRCDGKVFSYDEVNTANMSDTSNSLTVNGGQGRSPLAYIDTDRNTELTFTSSLFTLEMFEMANAEEIEEKDYATLESKLYDVNADNEIVLPFEVKEESVKIRGFEEADEAATGKFSVEIMDASEEEPKTVITFDADDVEAGDTLRVAYKRRVVNGDRVTVKTDSTTAKGSFYAHYPLYSSGSDCTESSQKGTLHIYFPKCRATALPGFDASYKSAQAPGVTFSTIDPKRADKKIFDIMYEDKSGEISLADTTFVFGEATTGIVTAEANSDYLTANIPVHTDPGPIGWSEFGPLYFKNMKLNQGEVYEFSGIPDNLPDWLTILELKLNATIASEAGEAITIKKPVLRFTAKKNEFLSRLDYTIGSTKPNEEPISFTITPTIKKVIDWD